jgi:glycosyltransferase involved in cell wall biosynthesis
VLLATYNGSAFLEAQLASLDAQDYPRWRLLARDDGSTDATPQILRAWAARHPGRIALLEDSAGRQGVVGNFSRLLAAGDATWFMFCDQDDFWLPDKLSAFAGRMAALESRLGRDTPILIHSDLAVVDRDLASLAPSFWRRQRLDVRRGGRFRALLRRNVVTGCACMGNAALRRLAVPVPAEALMHDWWLALVAAAAGHVEVLDRATVLYRQHEANEIGSRPVGWPALPGAWLRHPHWELVAIPRRLRRRQMQAVALQQRLATRMPPERYAECAGFIAARRARDIVERIRDWVKVLKQE